MKRFITAALITLIVLNASGCSGSDPDNARTDSKTTVIDYESDSVTELTPIYNNSAVVSAYKSGDDSELSEFDKAIYDAAVVGIDEFYREGMSEIEIVRAAHDYITTLCTYDIEELSLIPKRSENSESPYGVLINKRAICMGYTTSFQMFMDMLGVESIIVRGESDDEEHAWNMVHIGDSWYHIDCTWDDYVPDYAGRPAVHIFYMMTDGAAAVEHIWDYDATPKADSEELNYYRANDLFAENKEEIAKIISNAVENGLSEAEFALPKEYNTENMYLPTPEGVNVYTYWPLEFDTYKVVVAHITLEK